MSTAPTTAPITAPPESFKRPQSAAKAHEDDANRRYFHGTTAVLNVGDVLVPGNSIGTATFGPGDRSAHVYTTSACDDDAAQFAVTEAEEWGCDHADSLCERITCGFADDDPFPHHKAWRDGEPVPCVFVYEVAPVDPASVEPDDSSDIECDGRRMSAARVIRVILGNP